MAVARPDDLYSRTAEWADLSAFVRSRQRGLRVAVVYGRRRQGKSYLLRRLVEATGGFYHQALEEDATPALARFAEALSRHLDLPGRLAFTDWADAVEALAELGPVRGRSPVVVIDELPYLIERSPDLPSALQRAVDRSRDGGKSVKLVLCGSALSVMTQLLNGQRALRGRVDTELLVQPFDFREAADFWDVADWTVAVRLHAILGGTPGYRDLVAVDPPRHPGTLGTWLGRTVLNPSSSLFREDDYLLSEERGLTDRALYHSVLGAIANGCRNEATIAARLGREQGSLAWPLKVLTEAGFVVREDDAFKQRRPVYRVSDPIVRFHQVVTRRDLARFEERRAVEGWRAAEERFRAHVLGPHFEGLAREWVDRFASGRTTGGPVAHVAAAQVNDPKGRSRLEVDVVGLESPGRRRPRVRFLGEAKVRAADGVDLVALERARALLDAPDAKLGLFSMSGFSDGLLRDVETRKDVELVDLERLYTGS